MVRSCDTTPAKPGADSALAAPVTVQHAARVVPDPEAAVALPGRLRSRLDTAILAIELVSGGEVLLTLRHVSHLRAPFSLLPDWMVMLELGSADPQGGLAFRLTSFLEEELRQGTVSDAVIPAPCPSDGPRASARFERLAAMRWALRCVPSIATEPLETKSCRLSALAAPLQVIDPKQFVEEQV